MSEGMISCCLPCQGGNKDRLCLQLNRFARGSVSLGIVHSTHHSRRGCGVYAHGWSVCPVGALLVSALSLLCRGAHTLAAMHGIS